MTDIEPQRPARAFLPLYALANAGGMISYIPFLTLLVPIKVTMLAPASRIELLSAITIIGAVAASIANITFGIASDRSYRRRGSRRRWIAGGLVANAIAAAALAAATTPASLIGAIIVFQIAVNMVLAPLAAMLADSVADAQKGVAGGALALAPAAGSVVAAAVTAASGIGPSVRFAAVAAIVIACVLPILTIRPIRMRDPEIPGIERVIRRGDLFRISLARLSLQVAGGVLFTYLLFYFETLGRAEGRGIALAPRVATLTMLGHLIAFPMTLWIGSWSDRTGRRKPFLLATSGATALGLVVMAMRTDMASAAIGYGVFTAGGAIFLSLQSTYAMQVLPSSDHRGRDLGFVNLANTIPAIIASMLAWAMIGRYGYAPLLMLLGLLVVLGGILTLTVRSEA